MGRVFIRSIVSHPWSKLIFLSCAIISLIASGVVGLGRSQEFEQHNYDVRFFYVAGLCWLKGLSPYNGEVYYQLNPELINTPKQGGFFYPPQMAPLALFLALFSWLKAQQIMTLLNVLSIGAIAFFSVRPLKRSDGWLDRAIIIGNPLTTYAVWAGQTSLLAGAALVGSWYYGQRGRWLIGGILLGVATIKPQLSFFIVLWMLLERRWLLLGVAAVTIIVLSIVPILVSGFPTPFLQWLTVLGNHQQLPFNNVGYKDLFNLRNFLFIAGISVPNLLTVGIFLTLLLWRYRTQFVTNDFLGVLLSLSLLFGIAHNYDLPVLAPLVASFSRYARDNRRLALLSFSLMLFMFIPQRLFSFFQINLLFQLQLRVLVVFIATIWLLVISHKNKAMEPEIS